MKKKKAKKVAARKPAKKAAAKKAPAKKRVSAIPRGYHTVTPYLVCKGAASAMAFYTKAFGAKETSRMPGPDGSVMHGEMRIGDSMIMLSDENPQMGAVAPSGSGVPVQVFLYVKDVDRAFAQAVAAGAKADMPPMDMFWGDRFGKLTDPFGHKWSMATHTEDVSPKEMGRRMAAEMAKQQPGTGQ